MTPREFTQQVEGYRWRDERDWEKCAVLVAHLGFHDQPMSAKMLLDRWRGHDAEAALDALTGQATDPLAALDAALAAQAARKGGPDR